MAHVCSAEVSPSLRCYSSSGGMTSCNEDQNCMFALPLDDVRAWKFESGRRGCTSRHPGCSLTVELPGENPIDFEVINHSSKGSRF